MIARAAALEARLAVAQAWCDAHPEAFPKDRKSLDFEAAVVGYRTGMPRLKTLRGWTWERVLEAVKRANRRWLRVKEEVDKEAILAELRPGDRVESCGVQCVQDESFFVEPKLEAVERRLAA